MLTRIPINTIPGLITAVVNTDILVMPSEGVSGRVTRTLMRRDAALTSGSVFATLRNATGGGGSGIGLNLLNAFSYTASVIPLSFTSSESIYLRVSSASATSEDLSGWIEVDTTAQATAALTSLSRVKSFYDIAGSDSDDVLNDAINGVSTAWQRYMRRSIVSTTIVGEKHSGGQPAIVLKEYPAVDGTLAIIEDGVALASTDFELDAEKGRVYRVIGGSVDRWSPGRRNISVDYSAGFVSVPEDLQIYATQQVLQIFKQSKIGGDRLGKRGTILESSGSAEYLIGPYVPGAQEVLDRYRDWRIA